MIVRFVIPNRDDESKPPTTYEEWACDAVPREGEAVYLHDTAWRVKWVAHTFELGTVTQIDVRLIEPDHWSSGA